MTDDSVESTGRCSIWLSYGWRNYSCFCAIFVGRAIGASRGAGGTFLSLHVEKLVRGNAVEAEGAIEEGSLYWAVSNVFIFNRPVDIRLNELLVCHISQDPVRCVVVRLVDRAANQS